MLKKIMVTMILAVVLSLAIGVPVFADQPDTPGGFGRDVSHEARVAGGFSDIILSGLEEVCDPPSFTLGDGITAGLEFWGVPPAHTP